MKRIVIGVIFPTVLVTAGGCVATRDWVQETVDKRVGALDADRRQDAARVDQQGRRLDGLEGSVNEVSATARGARTRADEVDARLTRLWDKRNARDLSDSVSVQFGFNRSDLDDAAQTSLVALVRELQQNPKLMVELQGYADAKGPRDYNIQLSQRRVETVRRYLVQNGVELWRIQSIGLGSINDSKTPDASKRRVTVKVMVPAD